MSKIRDRIYAWGYVIDNVPTALPFVFGETRCSLETEAEFLRSLLSTYSNLHPFLRERVLYKVKFKELEQAIKGKEQIRAEIEGDILEIEPLGFSRDEVSKYATLKFQVGKQLFDQRVKGIEILKI